MANETNMTRDINVEAEIYISPKQYLDIDNADQMLKAVSSCAEKNIDNKNDGTKIGASDLFINDIEFKRFEDQNCNEISADEVKNLTEEEIEDRNIVAVIYVEADATDNAIEYFNYNREPDYCKGNEAYHTGREMVDSIEKAFEQFGIEVIDSDISDVTAPEWENVMEQYEANARAEADDFAYDNYADR